jgi:hypothetical protein
LGRLARDEDVTSPTMIRLVDADRRTGVIVGAINALPRHERDGVVAATPYLADVVTHVRNDQQVRSLAR